MPLVAFDLDGTLVDQAAAARAWADEFGVEWRLPVEEIDRIGRALMTSRPKGEVFAELARSWSLPIAADQAWQRYRARMPDLVRCAADDVNALGALREAGWTLGIVTNGMVDNQEGKIRRTGLAELVDGWVISSEVGSRKPDAGMFDALARKLNCPLDGWMVGDSYELDVVGGTGVGLRTAWVTDLALPLAAAVPATIVVGSVADAVRQILTW